MEHLCRHTTLRLGGPCPRFETAPSVDALVERVGEIEREGAELFVLGGGSNLVVADEGSGGRVVVKLTMDRVAFERDGDDVLVRAEAGASWDELVARCVSEGLSGIEALSGIPGSVGATPMQNVGAYGQEVSDVITRVRVYDRAARALVWLPASACGFGYRSSDFRGKTDRIIVEVEMRLPRSPLGAPVRYAELARALSIAEGGRAPLALVRETILTLRRGKGMVLDDHDPESRSAGSFFTNPIVRAEVADAVDGAAGAKTPRFPASEGRVKLAAGWLIERAGFQKGQRFGRVHISSKHALALVTEDGATTRELLDAARSIQRGVRERFAVTLEPEPIFLGCSL